MDSAFRLKRWYDFIKGSKIVHKEEQVTDQLVGDNGLPIKQSYFNNMKNGRINLPDHILKQISEIYPFTNYKWLSMGIGEAVEVDKLWKFMMKTHDMTKSDISNKIGVSKGNLTSDNYQHFFNRYLSYRFDVEKINSEYEVEEPDYFDKQTSRFIEVMEYLIENRAAGNIVGFCNDINRKLETTSAETKDKLTPQKISNFKAGHQAIRNTHVEGMKLAYPFVNLDYLFTGQGSWKVSISKSSDELVRLSNKIAAIEEYLKDVLPLRLTSEIISQLEQRGD